MNVDFKTTTAARLGAAAPLGFPEFDDIVHAVARETDHVPTLAELRELHECMFPGAPRSDAGLKTVFTK